MNHKTYYSVSIKEIDLDKLNKTKKYHFNGLHSGSEPYIYLVNNVNDITHILLEEDEYKKLVKKEDVHKKSLELIDEFLKVVKNEDIIKWNKYQLTTKELYCKYFTI